MEFSSVDELKNHRKEVHPATFHCDICGIGFEDQIGFFEHLKTHYEKPKKQRGRPRKNAVVPESPPVIASSSKLVTHLFVVEPFCSIPSYFY
jgi:hypothetical protein